MGSEGHQDIDLAILTALLKGGFMNKCICACSGPWMYSKWPPFHCHSLGMFLFGGFLLYMKQKWQRLGKHSSHSLCYDFTLPFLALLQGKCVALSFKILLAYQTNAFDTEHQRCHENNIPIILIKLYPLTWTNNPRQNTPFYVIYYIGSHYILIY